MSYTRSIDVLNKLRKRSVGQWIPYFLGAPIFQGNTKVYVQRGTCRRKIIDRIKIYDGTKECTKRAEETCDKLENSGMLEFRKIGDLSPMFPHNIKNISEGTAKRIKEMVDSSDEEMINLALTILEELQKEKI